MDGVQQAWTIGHRKLQGHLRQASPYRHPLIEPDHPTGRAGHADIGDVGGAARENALIRRGHVRVRADHGRHAAIQMERQRFLFL